MSLQQKRHHRKVEEGEDEEGNFTKQYLSSSVDVKEQFDIYDFDDNDEEKRVETENNQKKKKIFEVGGNMLMSVCQSRNLVASQARYIDAIQADTPFALYSYSAPRSSSSSSFSCSSSEEKSSTTSSPIEFKLLQLFRGFDLEIYDVRFSSNGRFLFITGDTTKSAAADVLFIDFQDPSSEKGEAKKKYELKSLKIDLWNFNSQKFQYTFVNAVNRNSTKTAFSVLSNELSGTNANGIVILDESFDVFSYIDFVTPEIRETGDLDNFCAAMVFAPHNENLLAFAYGQYIMVFDVSKQQQQQQQKERKQKEGEEREDEREIARFECEKSTAPHYVGSYTVCWPRSDSLIYGVQDLFYIADVSQKSVVRKIPVPSSMLQGKANGVINNLSSHPFRSSSIVYCSVSNYTNKRHSYFFFDIGSVSVNKNNNSSIEQQHKPAHIVHQVDIGENSKVKQTSTFLPTCTHFLTPSCLLSSGSLTLEKARTATPALLCFHGLPSFSWNERKKVWLIREKGNQKNVAIVRVLNEIYFVCQLVCLFA